MPTFDFHCQNCSEVFEFSRSFGSKEHPACPACGSKKTEKKIAVPAITFKGSGFYKTDSQSRPVKKTEKKIEDNKATATKKKESKKAENKTSTEKKTKK